MKYQSIREEELKNKVAHDYFSAYDSTKIIGNVDFCICLHKNLKNTTEQNSLLWAEAKTGSSDIYKSIVQLILTVGKARTFDKFLPPAMLGAFDGEKIAFIPYSDIHEIFYVNDFNWKVRPSNYETKEFKLIHQSVKSIIDSKALLFDFINDDRELKLFIKNNFVIGKFELTKTKIDKTNFMVIYSKWLQVVKPTIAVKWDIAKNSGIIDGDFYLADLLSRENNTLKENLFVLLKHNHYELDRKLSDSGLFSHSETSFTDKQVAHTQFWNKYDRPPNQEYWDYIVARRDLLVPQDVRERKGSFFTPQNWVELSQKYLTDVLNEDWQDEYYIWDCAAGTGNLLAGLTNKYNIWASTLDTQDVEVMHDRIKNGANLLDDHVFQFDFLNDDFSKLPKPLQEIISNPIKRTKLVVYINPPYAETMSHGAKSKEGLNLSMVNQKYISKMGKAANRELYAQFLTRIYSEIPGCIIAEFSKLKALQSPNFVEFRRYFLAKILKCFIVPANTFDNVKGNFPIGFKIWDTSNKSLFEEVEADIYTENGKRGIKKIFCYDKYQSINDWIMATRNRGNATRIGFIACLGNDFQQNNVVHIMNDKSQMASPRGSWITDKNITEVGIYFAVRKCIEQSWLNDRDQFLHPNENWQQDTEFQNDCLAFTLFNTHIQSGFGVNHWIPFSENEVNAREKFESNFMYRFLNGKMKLDESCDLFGAQTPRTTPLVFSSEATEVFDAAREVWKYYHSQPFSNANASLYDIKEHFQGRNDSGKMKTKSTDDAYDLIISELKKRLRHLADKIVPKVHSYGFLK